MCNPSGDKSVNHIRCYSVFESDRSPLHMFHYTCVTWYIMPVILQLCCKRDRNNNRLSDKHRYTMTCTVTTVCTDHTEDDSLHKYINVTSHKHQL